MIMVTGGAGFIGSNLQAALARRGQETVVADWLGSAGKWRNLAGHPPARVVSPESLDAFLAADPPIDTVFHLGAISETTATDADLAWQTNVELSLRLWDWCAARGARMIYASSAATYGDGGLGFDDHGSIAHLSSLRPLNLYGWTKNAFDLRVAQMLAAGAPRQVTFIDLPPKLQGQYQSFTQASTDRLRAAGYAGQFTPLEEGIRHYVQDHLAKADPYL
jgi:ADP-L-glycero-D-manno-heptose 6-epimerase